MQADHSRITKVDTQTPFHSKQDAFQRLAAYHVYYEPEPSEAIENRGKISLMYTSGSVNKYAGLISITFT